MDGKTKPCASRASVRIDIHPAELLLRHRNYSSCICSEKLVSDIMTSIHPEFLISQIDSGNAVQGCVVIGLLFFPTNFHELRRVCLQVLYKIPNSKCQKRCIKKPPLRHPKPLDLFCLLTTPKILLLTEVVK